MRAICADNENGNRDDRGDHVLTPTKVYSSKQAAGKAI